MAGKVWYPIFLDIDGRRAVVVGAGKVALRKVKGLLEAGARVTVVAPRFEPGFDGLPVQRIEREFDPGDIADASLVFAATDSREVNKLVGDFARDLDIPANIADSAGECAFLVPARIRRENLQIAISTSGLDPARAANLRQKLEEWLDLMRP